MIAAFMEANWCLSMTGEKPQIQITKDNREKRKEVALERRNPQPTGNRRYASEELVVVVGVLQVPNSYFVLVKSISLNLFQ